LLLLLVIGIQIKRIQSNQLCILSLLTVINSFYKLFGILDQSKAFWKFSFTLLTILNLITESVTLHLETESIVLIFVTLLNHFKCGHSSHHIDSAHSIQHFESSYSSHQFESAHSSQHFDSAQSSHQFESGR
jgi:hypothetical protein